MPGPGASVEALAAMMCTAAHGDVGAGTAPTEIAEAITTNAVNAAENILRLVSCRLFLRPLYTPTPDYFNLWGNEVFFFRSWVRYAFVVSRGPSVWLRMENCGLHMRRKVLNNTRAWSPVADHLPSRLHPGVSFITCAIYLFPLAKSTHTHTHVFFLVVPAFRAA